MIFVVSLLIELGTFLSVNWLFGVMAAAIATVLVFALLLYILPIDPDA